MTARWGGEDPAAVAGSLERPRRAFVDAAILLRRRLELFTSLLLASLEG